MVIGIASPHFNIFALLLLVMINATRLAMICGSSWTWKPQSVTMCDVSQEGERVLTSLTG
jgi:hypothetical protein